MRPITLAATLHCAWSIARYTEAMTWAKKTWLHKTVHGGIPGSRVQHAIWPPLLKMEATTKDEKEEAIATAAIDSEKYFDSICWEVTFQMFDRMGLDQRIWKPMLNFIAHLKRFNKVAGTLGPTWTCTEQHHTGMLPESGNSGTVNSLAKSSGGRSTHGHLQQHCGRSGDSLRQEKKRGTTTEIGHPDHERP